MNHEDSSAEVRNGKWNGRNMLLNLKRSSALKGRIMLIVGNRRDEGKGRTESVRVCNRC